MLQEIFVPGRLCILGEHTDWAAGYREENGSIPYGMTVVCATNEGLFATCAPCRPGIVRFCSTNTLGEERTVEMPFQVKELSKLAATNNFFCYVAGTSAEMIERFSLEKRADQFGLDINNYKTTLPMGKGLSSSAAVCVLVVKCFCAVFNLDLSLNACMELAYRGEMRTASRCGRMDQCVAMGPSRIGCMEFDRQDCHLKILSCLEPLHFVVADLNRGKNTVEILKALRTCFPFPNDAISSSMHFYVEANQRLAVAACDAITTGDTERLGAVMNEAQQIFDCTAARICPDELTSPRLHYIMQHPSVASRSLAAKGVGSQGDGSIQILCRNATDQSEILEILNNELGCSGFRLTIDPYENDGDESRSVHGDYHYFLRAPRSSVLFFGATDPQSLLCIPGFLLSREKNCRNYSVDSLLKNPLLSALFELCSCAMENIILVLCGAIDSPPKDEVEERRSIEDDWNYSDYLMDLLQRRVSVYTAVSHADHHVGVSYSWASTAEGMLNALRLAAEDKDPSKFNESPVLVYSLLQDDKADGAGNPLCIPLAHLYAINPFIHNLIGRTSSAIGSDFIISRDVSAAHSDIDKETDTLCGIHQFIRSCQLIHSFYKRNNSLSLSMVGESSSNLTMRAGAVLCVSPLQDSGSETVQLDEESSHANGTRESTMFSAYRLRSLALVSSLKSVTDIIASSMMMTPASMGVESQEDGAMDHSTIVPDVLKKLIIPFIPPSSA